MTVDDRLPRDAQSILELAARSMFELFANASEGMMLVDRHARVVWINDQYRRFLPALGFEREEDFVGQPVSAVVQNTQMHQVLATGKPILIDLLTNRAGTFVVSRIPLRDSGGEVIGVLGIVLFDHPETTLQPLITKFARLEQDLSEARRELASQRRTKYTFASFVGTSGAAHEVKRQARRAAQSGSPVLLLGETGTGKELLAHAIHAASPRAGRAFVGVNMAAVPEALLEAEFFGVAPGAYTGADRKGRDGKFRLADGGTLFLDELGDMPMAVQVKLLRALQDGEIEPLGSNRIVRCDVRVVAATSRDLVQLVRDGLFREDLYYRLNVLPVRVPALRDRRDDIPLLVEALSEDIAVRSAHPQLDVQGDAMALLQAQAWRGNIRELRNVLEQLALRCESGLVDRAAVEHVLRESGLGRIEPAMVSQASDADIESSGPWPALSDLIRQTEQQAVTRALRETQGNRAAAARLLGMSRASLYDKLKAWGWLSEK
ncbi:MAG: sigma 54-interacting transcriptional regulator [Burkholderiaceae bacterium]